MEITDTMQVNVSRERVWNALNDPIALKGSIPGCEEFVAAGESIFKVTVITKLGPIKARFEGKVRLENVKPPLSYVLIGEGTGGAAGFAKATIRVDLEALAAKKTAVHYAAEINLGGKIAQLGSRMLEGVAHSMTTEFFRSLDAYIERKADGQSTQEPPHQTQLEELYGDRPQERVADDGALNGHAVRRIKDKVLIGQEERSNINQPMQESGRINPRLNGASRTENYNATVNVLTSRLIDVWVSDDIAVVSLNRPKKHNAMTLEMWCSIPMLFQALSHNAKVKAIIVTGTEKDFCSGADIDEFEKLRDNKEQAESYEAAVDACCDAISNVPKPTIAVVKGYCLGGGAHLAMSCDFRYADSDAVFGIPAARLSIIYGVKATKKLLGLVGISEAKRILYSGKRFNAEEGLRIGFLDHVSVPTKKRGASWLKRTLGGDAGETDGDSMRAARQFAHALAKGAPLTIGGAKMILNEATWGSLDMGLVNALIGKAASSFDYKEARKAFSEHREPVFTGV